ncbi:hypothetical protein WG66_002025 [Moniliophthora roreri]|nr:hypothetical protein WG66_002025 [Moniliophthora roreri]
MPSTVSVASIQLPPDAIDRAYTEARKEAHIGSKSMGLRRYPTIACGVITGLAAGYLFTEAFKETHIRLLKQEATKAASNPEQGASTPISDKP